MSNIIISEFTITYFTITKTTPAFQLICSRSEFLNYPEK